MSVKRTTPTRDTTTRRARSPEDGLGRALRWLRWPVVVVWLLAIIALNPLASTLSNVTNNSASAYLPSAADSAKVVQLEQAAEHRPGKPDVDAVVVVFARAGGLTAADRGAIAATRAAMARLTATVSDLSGPGRPVTSADGKAALITADVITPASSETANDTAAVKVIRDTSSAAATRAHDGLDVAVTGAAAFLADSAVSSNVQRTCALPH